MGGLAARKMAGVARKASSALSSIVFKFAGLNIRNSAVPTSRLLNGFSPHHCVPSFGKFHTSAPRHGLEEFFDDKSNWGEQNVKVGRAWKKDELRIKSNEDLHKLWYVLLKERNMLLTMEHASKEDYYIFASPERIDKVKESMQNLEEVVRERNRAYHLLETGETGEREISIVKDQLGRKIFRRHREYVVPIWMNRRELESRSAQGTQVSKFVRLLKEQKHVQNRRAGIRVQNHVARLLRRYPEMDLDKCQEQYPEVDVRAIKRRKVARGHHLHNIT